MKEKNDLTIKNLRESVVNLLTIIFKKYCTNSENYAIKLENELFNGLIINQYIDIVVVIDEKLILQDGNFNDDILINKYINNIIDYQYIINYQKTDQNIRQKILRLFINALLKYEYFNNDKTIILQLANKIELSCYKYAIININNEYKEEYNDSNLLTNNLICNLYNIKTGIIYNYLNKDSITYKIYKNTLINQIINNEIDIENIAFLTEKQLCPIAFQKEQNEINIRSEQQVIEKECNLFQCPNCKQRKITYKEVQIRSIDEAPDYLCTCLNCKHKFKA